MGATEREVWVEKAEEEANKIIAENPKKKQKITEN